MANARWLSATHQLWKVRGAAASGVLGVVGAFATFLWPDDALMMPLLGGSVACFVLLIAFGVTVKCRICDEYVFVRAFRESGDWWNALYRLDACPNCGARDNDSRLV